MHGRFLGQLKSTTVQHNSLQPVYCAAATHERIDSTQLCPDQTPNT